MRTGYVLGAYRVRTGCVPFPVHTRDYIHMQRHIPCAHTHKMQTALLITAGPYIPCNVCSRVGCVATERESPSPYNSPLLQFDPVITPGVHLKCCRIIYMSPLIALISRFLNKNICHLVHSSKNICTSSLEEINQSTESNGSNSSN